MTGPDDPAQPCDAADVDGFPVSSDAEHLDARDAIEVLATRFADEMRRGERPSIEEYARRHKACADQIRELFPLIESLEGWKNEKEVESLRRSVPREFTIQRLGEYQIVRELGRGGMGVVFEAVQKKSGRRVAVKLLPWKFEADRPQRKERFRREAATIAGLRHKNIVRVYSFGRHDGYCYYVMDLVDGIGLDAVLQHWRASEQQREGSQQGAGKSNMTLDGLDRDAYRKFADIGIQVASALVHAHERGVLHNDIKPANLLLRGNGEVVVTDFGIGLRTGEDLDRENDLVPGTLRYMAPERLLGHSDARSDVYSLGATLYELATQTPAFDAPDRRQLIELILHSHPRRPRRVNARIPRSLETIIFNAMATDPDERYPSAKALAADLLRFMNGQRIRSLRLSLWQRAARWVRRRRAATS